MKFRELTIEDIPSVATLYVAAFNAWPWKDQWTEATAGKRLRQMLQRPSAYGLLAYDEDGHICGMILGDEEQFYNGPQFQVREFCVDNSRRGQGLGTQLYQELERRLRQRGIAEVVLYTLRHRATQGFYEKMGMQIHEEMICMQKKLI